MEQAKALDALEPFVALAKSATSPRAAADLVVRATSHPNTYVFAELLRTPQVQALAAADAAHAAHLTLLQIFSYGTYADYEATAPRLPLNEAQASKLRQLSLITLARDRQSLGYDHLVKELGLPDARALETVVTLAVYAGLVGGTLDPAHAVVHISSVAPLRDLAPGAVPRLREALHAWAGRCEATLADLDAQIAAIRRAAAAKADEDRAWNARFARALDDERAAMLRQADLSMGFSGSGSSIAGTTASPGAFSSATSPSSAPHGKKAMTLNVSSPGGPRGKPRFMKRGSNHMADSGGSSTAVAGGSSAAAAAVAEDNEDMDLDDDADDAEGNKRASRRKL